MIGWLVGRLFINLFIYLFMHLPIPRFPSVHIWIIIGCVHSTWFLFYWWTPKALWQTNKQKSPQIAAPCMYNRASKGVLSTSQKFKPSKCETISGCSATEKANKTVWEEGLQVSAPVSDYLMFMNPYIFYFFTHLMLVFLTLIMLFDSPGLLG